MNESKYRTLLETLKNDILSGKCNSGASFPSLWALLRRHGLSENAVQRAIDELTHQGLLSRTQGRGTFVTRGGAQRKLGVFLPRHAYSEIVPRINGEFSRLAQKGSYTLLFGDITATKQEQRAKAAKRLAKEFVLDAEKNPANHRYLIVRVGGWSGYFVELDRECQDLIIRRMELDAS